MLQIRSVVVAQMSEISTYPSPPAHYTQFDGPTSMQPPDISTLGPTYRMFGQIVQNPTHVPNAVFPVPLIDKDVLKYDTQKPVKEEIIRLIDTLPKSILELMKAIQNTPSEANGQLRDFDNRIKSLYHALETLRPIEAQQLIEATTAQEIKSRENKIRESEKVLEEALNILEEP